MHCWFRTDLYFKRQNHSVMDRHRYSLSYDILYYLLYENQEECIGLLSYIAVTTP